MPTQAEEQQVAEFLKRAAIRTMKKDLSALREVDALKERDKIAKLKTLEEQLEEKKKTDELVKAQEIAEKIGMKEVLEKESKEEKIAEKDLKTYATETERQQIFILESQRLGFEEKIDEIDQKKDPDFKRQKNNFLIQRRDQEEKLQSILAEEKKLEDEQRLIAEKARTTTIESQRKSMEKERAELETKMEEIEKKRWAAEKVIQDTNAQIAQVDKLSEGLLIERNELRDKVLGLDKSLRDIYSVIITREEEKRRGSAAEQLAKKAALAQIKEKEKEQVQRQQWSPSFGNKKSIEGMKSMDNVPKPVKRNLMEGLKKEEEERKRFLQDVEAFENKQDQNQSLSQPSAPMPPHK